MKVAGQWGCSRCVWRIVAAIAFAVLALTSAPAGQEVARIPIVDAPPKTPGLGGGLRLGPSPYQGGAATFDLVPLYLYEGNYLFAHGVSAGVHAFTSKRFVLDVYARYRFQRLDPEDDPFLEGLEPRRQSLDGGLALTYRGNWGQLRLDLVSDLLDRHKGQEAQFSYRNRFDRGAWSFSPFVNLTWQNDTLTDYYYGVNRDEARRNRPVYAADDAFNLGYGLNTSYQITDRIMIFGNFGIEDFGAEIEDSPLVDEDLLLTSFIGASYFFDSLKRATTPDAERLSEWSWRVNYGYQAEGNIVGEIDQGDFSKSTKATTQIGGVMASKLLIDGPRIDFLGRVAAYRHFEKPLQDNFWSFAAYIMLMGKGYLPWTDDASFRWGFGFGLSYAQQVPMAEQVKQAAKGEQTNRFLNYLEITLDFPLRRVTKAKALRNCYTGMTLVHRSGIFATADILGNVTGGSDWITLHLECIR